MVKSLKINYIVIVGTVLLLLTVFFYQSLLWAFPSRYEAEIQRSADEFNLDVNLVKGVIWTESKFDKDAISPKGARGLMQLMPTTEQWLKELLGTSEEDSAQLNIRLGCFYLRYLLDKFEDEKLALAAYNAGEGNVQSWIDEYDGEIRFKESREYVKRVAISRNVYKYL